MWIQHLFSLIGTAVHIFFDQIGATLLGKALDVAFALSPVMALFLDAHRAGGWRGMIDLFKQNHKAGLIFAAISAVIIYGPVAIWSVGKAVYDDHQSLVARSYTQRVEMHSNEVRLAQSQTECVIQSGSFKEKIAGLDATKTQLESQNRDQQGQITTCILQQHETPTFHSFMVSRGGIEGPHMEYVLTTNVIRSPVSLIVKCDTSILNGDISPMNEHSNPNFVSDPVELLSDKEAKFYLESPPWNPDTPLFLYIVFSGKVTSMPQCSFVL